MSTVMKAVSTAMSKALLSRLPEQAAAKFEIDEVDFKEFLNDFLIGELKMTKAKKPSNGKGKVSGYIVFSSENRQALKDEGMAFGEIGKKLGQMWRELDDDDKVEWNEKAQARNEENGVAVTKKVSKKASPKKTAAKKASKKESTGMKVTRDSASKSWLIKETKFVVQSPKNKIVIGKLRGSKVVKLSEKDIAECKKNECKMKDEEEEQDESDEEEVVESDEEEE